MSNALYFSVVTFPGAIHTVFNLKFTAKVSFVLKTEININFRIEVPLKGVVEVQFNNAQLL